MKKKSDPTKVGAGGRTRSANQGMIAARKSPPVARKGAPGLRSCVTQSSPAGGKSEKYPAQAGAVGPVGDANHDASADRKLSAMKQGHDQSVRANQIAAVVAASTKADAVGQKPSVTHVAAADRTYSVLASDGGAPGHSNRANRSRAAGRKSSDPRTPGGHDQAPDANQSTIVVAKTKRTTAPLPISATITNLVLLQRQRMFSIVQQSRNDRAVEAYIARLLGYRVALTEDERKEQAAERKALFALAQKIRLAIEADKPLPPTDFEIGEGTVVLVRNAAMARMMWDEYREKSEKEMRELVVHLPVYDFAKSVKGFGDLGLAIIIAEAGNNLARTQSGFPSVAKLWKRLGLAVMAGERQQRKTDPELALLHGYSPKRRSQSWVVGDMMIRHQLTSEASAYRQDLAADPTAMAHIQQQGIVLAKLKVEELRELGEMFGIVSVARPSGPYGEVYAKRRAATADRGWRPAHQLADAKRVMFKALVRDLWRVWNGLPARYAAPPDLAEAAD